MSEQRNSAPFILEYGHWTSPLSAEKVFQASEAVSYMRPCNNGVFFLLSMPQESNSMALMHRSSDGRQTRVSPAGINVRSRVHEYGGLPYAFTDDSVFYCNFRDQAVLKQSFDQHGLEAGPTLVLSPGNAIKSELLRYADFVVDRKRNRLICVREDYRLNDKEPANTLVAIDMDKGGEGEVLFADSDFVASPVVSADGELLAFQTWSHPSMPWDDTQIRIADLDDSGRLSNLRQVLRGENEQGQVEQGQGEQGQVEKSQVEQGQGEQGQGEQGQVEQDQAEQCGSGSGSLVQPLFNAEGELYFIADWNDWWNLYRVSAESLQQDCRAQAVRPMAAEFCGAQWQLGQHNYDFCDEHTLLVSFTKSGFWDLALLDINSGELTTLQSGLGMLENVYCQAGKAVFSAASPRSAASIQSINLQQKSACETLFTCSRSDGLNDEDISMPEHIGYQSEGKVAYGIFYPPRNTACIAPEGTLPPLLVLVHGGPTGCARVGFNPALQFWTSRGFAVLDVNHRGSTGYGRRFRQSLYENWGVADVADVDNAVRHLIAKGRVAPDKAAIRGGSAGGYVVLAALVHSDLFSAGASYYGISDLELLASDTHKFESRYLDQLIGPYPAAKHIYQQRSPINHIDSIKAAVLLLQGMEDKVVPPNQAEMIYKKLHEKNPATRYLSFADEGHGFRNPPNQIAALSTELAFYQDNLW